MKILETDRLILRTWIGEDLESMFSINQDPKVMEYFPSLQDLDMTKNFIDKVNAHFENHGYSLYAAVRKDTNEKRYKPILFDDLQIFYNVERRY